ncbi:MAG: prolipoprotein diacylglyceryl transferase [Chloroflexi bacterium]|nr:prolipoprotein diacylglyceryl transferase [Chloroflexota bacterium]
MVCDPPGIHIFGSYCVRYYGIILIGGAIAAGFLSAVEARRRGQDPDIVWDGIVWALIGGILGARLWHVLTPSASLLVPGCVPAPDASCQVTFGWYLSHPLDMIAIWKGGLGIPGGVAGGVLGLYIFARRRKLEFAQWLDIAAPGVLLAQSIGRWGNFVNQELYGKPATLPWAIPIDPAHRLASVAQSETFHPLFLYESIYTLLACVAILYIARRYADRLKPGDLFLAYLVLYPFGRFVLEFLRVDISLTAGFNVNQVVAILLCLASAYWLWSRHRYIPKHRRNAAPAG